MLFAVVSVVFWKVMLKIVVMVVAISAIVLLAYGGFALVQIVSRP